jgi:hypothetical protein
MPGGATACVTAGRLLTSDPSLKILVVEGGKHSWNVPNQVEPCRFIEHLAPNSTTVTKHKSKPSVFLDGRSAVVTSGHTVGGGSAVNCKQWTIVVCVFAHSFRCLRHSCSCLGVVYRYGVRARRSIRLRRLGRPWQQWMELRRTPSVDQKGKLVDVVAK